MQKVIYAQNYDLDSVATPVRVEELRKLLLQTNYPQDKTNYLVEGFTHGFDIGFYGPRNVVRETPNMKFCTGTRIDLWNKIMKEVQEGHTAGPYVKQGLGKPGGRPALPFSTYWQNPVGLIPKKGNPNETRMIVNLSYKDEFSVNHFSKKEECTVTYNDIDKAVKMIQILQYDSPDGTVFLGKCDGKAAFRQLPVSKRDQQLLVMKAEDPKTGEECFFIDKVIVFGSSRSCRIFSEFASALAHIAHKTDPNEQKPNEYLDDVLTGGTSVSNCNESLSHYLHICDLVNFPISEKKTVWATTVIIFLGLLLNTITRTLSVPEDKRDAALNQIDAILRSKRILMRQLQRLTGLLNFLCRAIVPGRAFTRRLYYRIAGVKQHHHIRVDQSMKDDLKVWMDFLKLRRSLCRPFIDFNETLYADELDFYSDASKSNDRAAFGVVFRNNWTFGIFPQCIQLLEEANIQTLEMFAVMVGVVLFAHKLKGRRVIIFCDNQAVVQMINNGSSKCKTCMRFIRRITLESMDKQVRIFARYVPTLENIRADALSRLDFNRFWKQAGTSADPTPHPLPLSVWPPRKEWWTSIY